jgi:intein/homing endonuclease
MARLFGFSIDDSNKKSPSALSPIPQNNEDGVDHYLTSGFFGSYVDIEGVYRTEFDLIKRYREMSLHPEVDSAIEDIVNEAIVSDTNDSPVQIELSNLNASDGLKKKIREEFKYILELLDFDKKAHEIYRNWYIDGRLYYHKVIDLKNPHDGIQELRYIDSMKMRYVRQEKKGKKDQNAPRTTNGLIGDQNPMNFKFPEIEEYFIYDPKSSYPVGGGVANMGTASPDRGVKIAKDAITYCTSGLVDRNKGTTLSYLNKAIKALNQLRMIEDSLVIYRLCLIGDTRVKTDTGYSYIKELNVGDAVYAYDNRVDTLVKTQVTNKWMTGTKKTYTVKSKHHNITGTDTHPVLVYDSTTKEVKYIPIKDLEPKKHSLTYIKPEPTNDIVLFSDVRERAYCIKDKNFWPSFKLEGKEKFIETLSEKTDIKATRIRNFLYGSQFIEASVLETLKTELPELENLEYEEKYYGFCNNELNLPEFVTPEFARLFGFLLGDGSVGKNRVVFAEGEDEEQNLYYANLMQTYFGNCNRYDSKTRKYTNYTTNNTLASELLVSLGYIPGAKNKRIPNWTFNASDEIKRQMVLGLLDADGHYRDLVSGFSCEISLCNKKLIEDIKELWTSIGLCSGHIRHRVREGGMRIVGEEKEPRMMPTTECYELYLSEYELPKFEKIMSVEYHSEEEVYDIEVEHEKHNFVANGIVVHNSRAPERRIFYIDVGNLPKVKAEQYLRDVMMRYRNKLVYDACLSMDTKVPLLDGRTLTLSEITEEFNKGERLWTYSCDPNTGKFAPGIISWAGVTRKNEKVVKLTLDNDETITCTLDHKFPVWNKGTVEAKDLQIGDSMIPFYHKNNQIFENESKEWRFIHDLVSDWKEEQGITNTSTQKLKFHKSGNLYDNTPENVIRSNISQYKTKEYKTSVAHKNHKIKDIEFLEETMDVGTLTIDKEELYHNYHTFALSAGIYTCNSTGEIRDDKKFMSMLEDFWLPRREGGRGTEIDTLPGGQNLGEITDINYFQSKLYKALNVPSSRIDGEGGFNLGRSSEILRDELKFSKFVGRLRKRFSNMFSDMLKTQLILKNIITPEDWEQMNEHIQYDFLYDNHFAELKDSELMTDRLNMLSMAEPYIGKYYSQDYVRRNILRQTDQEIVEQDELIKKEIKSGIIPDPSIPVDPNTGMPLDMGNNIEGDMGKVPIEPQVSEKGVEPPKGGEI